MAITFTQYMRPDGRKMSVDINRPADIETMALELQQAGVRLEAEVLTTGEVSFTAERDGCNCEMDIDNIEVVPNGPEVPKAVDRLIRKAHEAASDLRILQSQH